MTLATPRVTQEGLQVLETEPAKPRVTQEAMQVLETSPALPRVTQEALQVLVGIGSTSTGTKRRSVIVLVS
jgi:hypothetical protein